MAARLVCAARALTLGARAPRSALWTDGARVRPAALPSVVAVGPRGAAPAPALARFPTLATPRHALATHRPVSFAAVACRASSSPDSRFHPPEDDDDDVDALDDDDDGRVRRRRLRHRRRALFGGRGRRGRPDGGWRGRPDRRRERRPAQHRRRRPPCGRPRRRARGGRARARPLARRPAPGSVALRRDAFPSGSRTPSSPSRCAPTRTYADSTANGATRTRPRTSSLSPPNPSPTSSSSAIASCPSTRRRDRLRRLATTSSTSVACCSCTVSYTSRASTTRRVTKTPNAWRRARTNCWVC